MESTGWPLLAELQRLQREARWNHLPDETSAKVAWSTFRQAVLAVIEERARLEPSRDDTRDELRSG